jgi:hypothetical protein
VHLGSLRRRAPLLLLLAYAGVLFGVLSFTSAGLFERDGYFHARFARTMPERGLSRAFPFTQLSTWRESFCDKELLYHAAMMPFTLATDEPLVGAQVFSLLLALGVLAALYLVLEANRARWPLYFVILSLSMGGLFLARLTMIRSHVLSMLLQLVGLHLLVARRPRALFALGFLYAWSYTVPAALVMTSALFVLGRWVSRGGLDLRSLLGAGLGVAAGLVIHPYTPLTLETFLTYIDVLRYGLVGREAAGVELGHEIYPLAPRVFWELYPTLAVLAPAALLVAALARRRVRSETWGVIAVALLWFGMTLASARFAEYSGLFVAAAWGLLVRDLLAGRPLGEALFPGRARLRAATVAVLVAGALGLHAYCLWYFVYYETHNPPRQFRGALAFMERHLEPAEVVLNLDWDDFPELYYDGQRQRYIWGLDPTYTLRYDREATMELEQYSQRKRPLSPSALRRLTGARYMVLRSYRARAYPGLLSGKVPVVYSDALAMVFALRGD